MSDYKTPCKLCKPPVRHPGCHMECKGYLEWKAEYDAYKENIKEEKAKAKLYDSYKVELFKKQKKQKQKMK